MKATKNTPKKNAAKKMTVKEALKAIKKGQRMLHHSGRVLHAYYLEKFADHNKVIEVKLING